MRILAIETSCDETGAAVVESENGIVKILSNVVASSLQLHSKTGGIIPEVAAREQVKYIIPVVKKALLKTKTIDAIAVTYGPGLIGSLLVGVETAKALSFTWSKPIIPVNHLFGHIYANWIEATPEFPAIALVVSGGHTDLLFMKSHTEITWLGGTRDDAAGECFDKTGRLLGLPYPAGPMIEQKAKLGDPKAYRFPRPLLHDNAWDFSFSGLKTAVLREVQKLKASPLTLNALPLEDLCRGVQDAIIDVLVTKTCKAAEEFGAKSILLSGGVAANQTLRNTFEQYAISHMPYAKIFVPQKSLCTDNAAMIGAAAVFRNAPVAWQDVAADPELYFD